MSITRNNIQTSSTDTLVYTPPNVTDSCLVVLVSSEDVGDDKPITGVSFGTTEMILEVTGKGINGSNSNNISIAYLVNPSTTSQTITVVGGQHNRMGIVAVTLDNIDQLTPVNVSNGSFNTVAVSSFPTSATTTANDCYVISGGAGESNIGDLSVTGAVEFIELTPYSSILAAADSTQAESGTYNHVWVTGYLAGRYASASIAFNLATSAGKDITGSLNEQLDNNILSASGIIGQSINGSLSVNIEDSTLDGIGVIGQAIIGILSVTQEPNILEANGLIGEITGTLSVVNVDNTLSAFGIIGTISVDPNDISISSIITLEDINISSIIMLEDINLTGDL